MRRPGPEEWLQLIERYQASGLQQKEFCQQHEISLSTFQYWLYRRSKSKSRSKGKQAFVPVEVVALPAPEAQTGKLLEIKLWNGSILRFAEGTDPRYLAELLRSIG